MEKHPLTDLMETSMENLKNLVDVNTIIGDKIITGDGKIIIPISKVTFGFGSGGSDFPSKSASKEIGALPFGGGVGGGITISPMAFIVCDKDGVNLLELSNGDGSVGKVISAIPSTVSKLNDIFSKNKKNKDLGKTKVE